MVNKVVGYILVGAGLALLVINLLFRTWLQSKLPSMANFSTITIGIIALAAVVVGAFFLRGSNKLQVAEEVPIYQGKKIVGYRKEGK